MGPGVCDTLHSEAIFDPVNTLEVDLHGRRPSTLKENLEQAVT
jgi:hypothetical protein